MMGDKNTARATAQAREDAGHARQRRHRQGREGGEARSPPSSAIPVMIKATAGGGGKGMRPAFNEASARAELPQRPQRGPGGLRQRRRLHREAGPQPAPHRVPDRRRQPWQRRPPRRARLLAAAPQPEDHRGDARPACSDDKKLRKKMGEASVRLAKEIGYENCGTIEYLVDDDGELLLHGDEHADPGRAPDHRGGVRAAT